MYQPHTYSFTHTHTHFRHLISHHKRKSQGFSNTTTLFPQPSSGVVLEQQRVAHHLPGVFPFGIRRQQFQLHALLTMWCGDRSPQGYLFMSACICPPTSVETQAHLTLGVKAKVELKSLKSASSPLPLQEESMPKTSWSLLGPGVEVGLTLSFIDYVGLSLKQSSTAPAGLLTPFPTL